jgi:hypothetical protein
VLDVDATVAFGVVEVGTVVPGGDVVSVDAVLVVDPTGTDVAAVDAVVGAPDRPPDRHAVTPTATRSARTVHRTRRLKPMTSPLATGSSA